MRATSNSPIRAVPPGCGVSVMVLLGGILGIGGGTSAYFERSRTGGASAMAPIRADAHRNRQRLLEAASAAFTRRKNPGGPPPRAPPPAAPPPHPPAAARGGARRFHRR